MSIETTSAGSPRNYARLSPLHRIGTLLRAEELHHVALRPRPSLLNKRCATDIMSSRTRP